MLQRRGRKLRRRARQSQSISRSPICGATGCRSGRRPRSAWIGFCAARPLPRDHVIGKFPPRGGITTVETCAVALAMAGGRAGISAGADRRGRCFSRSRDRRPSNCRRRRAARIRWSSSTARSRKQIRLNSGFGCLGPDPQRPAGASIGRALRLMQQNVGGALPGIGAMANYGGMRYTNVVFAEDEENLPRGWPPHATERHGFARGRQFDFARFSRTARPTYAAARRKKGNAGRRRAARHAPHGGFHAHAESTPICSGYEKGTPGVYH